MASKSVGAGLTVGEPPEDGYRKPLVSIPRLDFTTLLRPVGSEFSRRRGGCFLNGQDSAKAAIFWQVQAAGIAHFPLRWDGRPSRREVHFRRDGLHLSRGQAPCSAGTDPSCTTGPLPLRQSHFHRDRPTSAGTGLITGPITSVGTGPIFHAGTAGTGEPVSWRVTPAQEAAIRSDKTYVRAPGIFTRTDSHAWIGVSRPAI
jgi:hypothetical protein